MLTDWRRCAPVNMSIHYDPTNLSADLVSAAHGLDAGEVAAGAPLAAAALAGFRRSFDEGRYGFPALPSAKGLIEVITAYAKAVAGQFDTICVAGIGGSALGAWALDCALRGPHPVQAAHTPKNPRLVILDNVDPVFMGNALRSMNPKKTLVVPIAKSGSTAETMATFLLLHDWLTQALGPVKALKHIAVVTSEARGDLKQFAVANALPTFHLPDNVGGRFSVLSAVGLVPAALIGVDIRKLCQGAAAMTTQCWSADLDENIALRSALHHYLLWTKRKKPIQVMFPYSNQLWGMAFWFRQLWAESLGKAKNRKGKRVNVGQTPVAALGATDQHSQVQLYIEGPNDKVFTFLAVGKWAESGRLPKGKTGYDSFDYLTGQTLAKLIDSERLATAAALTANARPNCTLTLDRMDEAHIGGLFQLLEFQTAFMGELLNIDAFDQEGVELGKRFTFGLMGRAGYEQYLEEYRAYEARRAAVKL
jgi:glucose-6-phosphate isomerase